ncbi:MULTISPECIES: hypothetical protein [unclassified Bradyrhizobium]|uniref:hypothetical protein n=1 Tax=unclassified Bradyrhizobium TaxID=2631580 RepID=UPI00211DF9E0|nr:MULTISPECIES: hypothetical protein [unclassified Bradyrhizobium]MDD1534577.1 hypothetical protein [Bradyrhizobium sp. WBOS8]MDD1581441.1 hypothetical protein [Bradyrhizobium sp. WBOS4]UUO49729.1 hypothetical protein DCM78_24145 [Bradyrhizobium sp. WBOS04]UUO58495.1 hypothetical protein DCM80_04425 [Bradyrhizobium sp. WBOS08]
MEYVRFAVKFTAFVLLLVLVVGYAYLVSIGELPKPDFSAITQQIAPSIATGGGTVLVLLLGVCGLLTALAPVVFAARSGDAFTVMISIVSLIACLAILGASRTVIDMVLAAIVYFTSAFIAVIVFAATRIEAAIAGAGGDRKFQAGPVRISRAD